MRARWRRRSSRRSSESARSSAFPNRLCRCCQSLWLRCRCLSSCARIKKEEAQPPPPPHVPAGCNWRPVWDEGHRAYYYCTPIPRLSLALPPSYRRSPCNVDALVLKGFRRCAGNDGTETAAWVLPEGAVPAKQPEPEPPKAEPEPAAGQATGQAADASQAQSAFQAAGGKKEVIQVKSSQDLVDLTGSDVGTGGTAL